MSAAGLRCAIYIRVSTDQQVEKYGLKAQQTETRATAKQRGYAVVGEYVDGGESGAKTDRDAFDKVRALVRDRAIEVVLTQQHDRFWRNAGEHLVFLAMLRKHGVRHDYVGWTPTDTKEGRLQEGVLAVIAEYERELIRDRTMRGTREKARQGLKPTGGAPFGYRNDPSALGGLAVDEAEAAIVRQVFTWAADGVAIRSIAARLDAQGLRPRRGARWSRTSVRTILHGDVYLGRGVYNRRDETGPDGVTIRDEANWIRYEVTPIVSPALAEKARTQLRRNISLLGGRPARRVYLLAGVAACSACGRRMHGDSRNPTNVYRCEGRLLPEAERCRFTMPADALDRRVWDALAAVIRDPDVLRSTAKASKLGIDARRVDAATEHAELTRAATKVRQSRERLLDLYVDGRIDKAAFAAREAPYKAEADRLEAAIAEVQARLVAGQAEADRHAAVVKYARLIGRGIERLDDSQRQALARKLVTRAVVHPDRVDVEGALQIEGAPGDGPKNRNAPAQSPENATGKLRQLLPSGASHGRPSATRRGRARASSRARRSHAQYTRRPRRSQRSQ